MRNRTQHGWYIFWNNLSQYNATVHLFPNAIRKSKKHPSNHRTAWLISLNVQWLGTAIFGAGGANWSMAMSCRKRVAAEETQTQWWLLVWGYFCTCWAWGHVSSVETPLRLENKKTGLLAISYSFGNKMQRVATFCWKPFPSRKMQGPRFVEGRQDNTRHKKHMLVYVRPMLARLRSLWEVSGRSLRGLWEVCGGLWEEHRRLWQLCALHGLLGCLGSNYSNSFHLKHKSSIEMS